LHDCPHTIWKNVSKLEATTYIRYDGKKIEKKKYWNVNQSPSTDDFESAKNKLDFMMRRSVQSRLLSDVPLGVFLSGGLDSSAILYYVKQFRQDVDTFSIGFGESSFDESVYAREVSKYFGTNHNEKMFSPKDCADSIQEVLSRIDEPIADASIIPTYLLANFARKKVTVALGGDGGDELFAGYPTFNAYKFYKLIRNIPFGLVKKSADIILRSIPVKFSNFSLDQKIAYFIKYHGADWRLVHDAWLGSFDDARINDVLSASAFSQLRLGDLHESSINSFYEVNQNEVDNRFLYQYLRGYLMDEVMVKVDRATMLNSLEARSPFLDYRIVEYVMSLPYEYKLAGFESKYILKELMKDKLRQNIIHRKKKGFGMPVAEWINGDLGHVFDQMLSNSSLKKTGLFNPDYITKLLSDHRSKKCNNRKELWNIFTFMYWYQTYFL
jgi:asparagine synthase (glutamine-hydrolysing)